MLRVVLKKYKGSGTLSNKIKLDDKVIKDHISDWSYKTKDPQDNTIIKQKGNRSYTPLVFPKTSD